MTTDLEQFKLFHECITKNNPEYTPFYIPLMIKGKDPLPGISWEKSHATYEQAIKYLQMGHNIGIVARENDRLVIMDKDDINAVGVTKQTLTVTSRKRYGEHGFYFTDDRVSTDIYQDSAKQNIATETFGEIRANEEYVVCAGSYVPVDKDEIDDAGVRTWDKVPEAEKDNAGKYTIHELNPVNTITFSELPAVYVDALQSRRKAEAEKNKETKTEHKEYHPPRNENNKSGLWDLTIGDVTGKNDDGSHRFPSLFHGSATGMNTSVNNGLMQCWRHSVSHTPLTALAILAGLGTCSSLGHVFHGRNGSSLDLKDGETQFKLWEYAKNNGLISKDDPIPSKALVWYALKYNLCDKSNIVEGWKLPVDAYSETIESLDSSKTPSGRKPIQYLNIAADASGNIDGNTCGNCEYAPRSGGVNCRHPEYRDAKGKPNHPTLTATQACDKFIAQNVKKRESQNNGRYFEGNIFRAKLLADEILSELKVLTVKGNAKEMYYYADGYYKTGATEIIETIAQEKLGIDTTAHNVDEVVRYIQKATRISRDKLFGEWFRINLKNGIYNLQTKTLEPHSPDKITIIQIPVMYDPQAKCPKISKFLCEVLTPENIPLVLQVSGYCLIPRRHIQKAIMMNGRGANGKGTLIRLLTAFLGKENISVESLQELNADKFSRIKLFGKLANICGDLKDTAINDDDVFKKITGNDSLNGQHKFENSIDFDPFTRLLFSANDIPPHKAGEDYPWNRRWIIIDFPCKFEGKKDDTNLDEKLQTPAELSGFLNLALCALEWLLETNRYCYAKTPDEVGQEYLLKSDPVAAFLNECTVPDDEDIPKKDLYDSYVEWAQEKGLKTIIRDNIFGKSMAKKGYKTYRPWGTTGERLPARYEGINYKLDLSKTETNPVQNDSNPVCTENAENTENKKAYTHWYENDQIYGQGRQGFIPDNIVPWIIYSVRTGIVDSSVYGLNLGNNLVNLVQKLKEKTENDQPTTKNDQTRLDKAGQGLDKDTKKSEAERKKEDDITYTIFKVKDCYDDVNQITKASWDWFVDDVMSCRNRPMNEAVEIVKAARIKLGVTA